MSFNITRQCKQSCESPCKSDRMGFSSIKVEKDGITYDALRECERHKNYRHELKIKNDFIRSGFNSEFFDSETTFIGESIKKNIVRLKNYIDNIDNIKVSGSFIYLYGDFGTQKTVFANWLGKQLIEKGIFIKYVLMQDLIKLLWAEGADSENVDTDLIVDLKRCDVLFIDEAFTGRSQWGGYLDDLLKKRITDNKGIIFISNYTPDQIFKRGYSKPTQELIQREILKRDSLFEFKDKYVSKTTQEILF